MKILRLMAAGALALVVSSCLPAAAGFAQVVAPSSPPTWNAGPLWEIAAPLIAAAIPACAVFLTWKVGQLLHVQTSDRLRGILETAMNMGLQLAQAKLPPGTPIDVTVSNKLARDSLEYVTTHAKDELGKLGYTPERVAESLTARAAGLMPNVVWPNAAAVQPPPPVTA